MSLCTIQLVSGCHIHSEVRKRLRFRGWICALFQVKEAEGRSASIVDQQQRPSRRSLNMHIGGKLGEKGFVFFFN